MHWKTKAAMLVLSLASMTGGTSGAVARELKFSLLLPDHHIFVTKVVKPFVAEVESKTKGAVTFKLYPSAVLGAGKEQLRLTETGIADLALVVPSYTRGRFTVTETGLLPFAFESAVHGTKVLEALRVRYVEPEYKTVKLIFAAMTSPTAILSVSKPLARLTDLKGLSLRGTGGAQKDVLTSLGANLVSIPASDLYVAMERRTIEGTVLSIAAAPGYKLEEIVKYVNRVNFSSTPITVVMNKQAWAGLTKEQQDIITAAAKSAALNAGKAYDDADESGLATLVKKGAKVVNFPAEDIEKLRAISGPAWKSWEATLAKAGVSAAEFMTDFRAAIKAQK